MKRLILIICSVLIVTSFSCDKGFEELNTNPLSPSNVSDGSLFNAIVNSLRLGWNRQLFLHNEVLYDVTEQAVVTAKTFGNISGGTEDIWTNYYDALKNANELYSRFNSYSNDPELGAVMKAQLDILMAYKTFQVTDLFGDIPFSEAGQVFVENAIIRAKYDNQESIYKTLLENLKSASELLSTANKTSQGNDYIRYNESETLFYDDLGKWVRFSNSLQLRHLVRMHDKDPDYAAERIQFLIESGANTIIKNGDAVMHPRNQLWTNLGVNWSFREHNKVRMGSTMWDFMTENNEDILDPRIHFFFEPNVNDEWVPFPQIADANTIQSGGEPYNKDRRDANHANKGDGNIYSAVNFYLVRDEKDIPEILMTSAEVQFLRAEIFLRGLGVAADPFLAQAAYSNGMIESLEFWQNHVVESEIWVNKPTILSTGELFATVQHPKYAFDTNASATDNLTKIYEQRWVDYFRQPWEAFSLLRRTNNVPREKPANDFFRFTYPPSEAALNTEMYDLQVGNMGGDFSGVEVWWMD